MKTLFALALISSSAFAATHVFDHSYSVKRLCGVYDFRISGADRIGGSPVSAGLLVKTRGGSIIYRVSGFRSDLEAGEAYCVRGLVNVYQVDDYVDGPGEHRYIEIEEIL